MVYGDKAEYLKIKQFWEAWNMTTIPRDDYEGGRVLRPLGKWYFLQ